MKFIIAELWCLGKLKSTLRLEINQEIVDRFNTIENLATMCFEVWGGGETKEGFTDIEGIDKANISEEKKLHKQIQCNLQKELSVDNEMLFGEFLLPSEKEEKEGVVFKFDFELL